MGHKTRNDQFDVKVRKGHNSKVRRTKEHQPKVIYNRKQKQRELEEYLAQTNGVIE